MNRKFKYLAKNVGILTVSNFASKILVFLLVPLYTSILSTAEYGMYDLVVSTVQLLFPLLSLNIVDAVMRFSMDKAYSTEEIATIGIRYIIRSFFPVILFLLICLKGGLFPQTSGYEILIFLYYAFYVLNQFFIQFAKGLEKIADMGIAGVLGTIVLIASNLYFLLVIKNGLYGFFIANILSQAIPCLYYAIRLKIWNYCKWIKINKSLQKKMLIYCLPLITTSLSWWINNTSDRYTVAFICGAAANGILSVAYKIPSILNTLQQIFIQAWQISAIKEYGGKRTKEFYGETFVYFNLLMCFSCSVLILTSKFLAHFLYANDFFVAWKYVPFLLIASVLNSASGFLGPILLAVKDSKSMAKSAIYGAAFNIILNILLIYLLGIQGATIATAISSYIIYAIRKKAVGDKILINSYWKVLLSWGILCILSVTAIFSLNCIIQILLIIFMLAINWESILKMFKSLKIIFYFSKA
ncbi:MAG: oligosaccharide flippase family protein [Lachnospiraceae bacterium]|nr:oligosaccharide flippase family protein [Lachnospiraceae bacterium]